jgi:uncharacterized protein YbaP (TraB family)
LNWFHRFVSSGIASGGIAILLGALGLAGAADAAPALWRVTSPTSEIYLFGTIHALTPDVHWRTPAYDAAYAKATTVWFEADLDNGDPATINGIIGRYGVDPQRTLSAKLPAPDLDALRRQVDVARIDHLRPWAAALMLSMQPVISRGASVQAGADLTMTRASRAQAKTVRTFETLEDQARLFASLSAPAELQYLTDIIHQRSAPARLSMHRGQEPLEQAWLDGDLARLGPRLAGDMRAENPALYAVLLKRRNLAWADALSREMSAPGVELVNVGALHMVGDDGLPTLMAARGFKVERVQ